MAGTPSSLPNNIPKPHLIFYPNSVLDALNRYILGPALLKLGIAFSFLMLTLPACFWGITLVLQQLHVIE